MRSRNRDSLATCRKWVTVKNLDQQKLRRDLGVNNQLLTGKLLASVAMAKAGKKFAFSVAVDLNCRIDKDGEPILPPTAAECADLLYDTTQKRLGLSRQLKRMEALETQLETWLIENLPVSNATGTAGQVARVQIKLNPVPTVEDWPKFYAYVKRTGAFDLMQKRLSKEAVQERWEAKKKIPGVGIFNAKKVSCTRLT